MFTSFLRELTNNQDIVYTRREQYDKIANRGRESKSEDTYVRHLCHAPGAGPSLRITRGSFFGPAASPSLAFSDPVETSVRSLSSDAESAAVAALGRPFFAPDFFPGEVAGLARLLSLPAFRPRSVRSDAGMGARGGAGMVCEESMAAKSSTVRASHGAGGAVCDGRPPRRFFVAPSSCDRCA